VVVLVAVELVPELSPEPQAAIPTAIATAATAHPSPTASL